MNQERLIPKDEQYRKNVALITFRQSGFLEFLLVNLAEWPAEYWKFPQGGVNPEESLEQAVHREFQEELGTDKINIIGKSHITRTYLWEKPKTIRKKVYIGQHQNFFIVEFFGDETDITVRGDEIRTYRWSKISDLESLIRRQELDFQDYWETIKNIFREQGWINV